MQGYLFAKPTSRDGIDHLVEGAKTVPQTAPLCAGLRIRGANPRSTMRSQARDMQRLDPRGESHRPKPAMNVSEINVSTMNVSTMMCPP